MAPTESCNPMNCSIYSSGWCEYDPLTDTIYPNDPENCPILKEDEC